MIKNLDKKIRAYALKNAIAYNGKANSGSVLSALFNEGLKKEEVKRVMPEINKIVLEIKCGERFSRESIDQVFSYLKANNLKLGILAQFTKEKVRFRRILNLR